MNRLPAARWLKTIQSIQSQANKLEREIRLYEKRTAVQTIDSNDEHGSDTPQGNAKKPTELPRYVRSAYGIYYEALTILRQQNPKAGKITVRHAYEYGKQKKHRVPEKMKTFGKYIRLAKAYMIDHELPRDPSKWPPDNPSP